MRVIPYGRQSIDADDEQAVLTALRSDFMTQGPSVPAFEKALCDYTGAKYCIVVASGTAALHLAVKALELEAGSEGITTPNTFAASANCMAYCGMVPRFADIDAETLNISPDRIREQITAKTKLLIPVHFAGKPAAMEEIQPIANEYGLRVIEDAAHAIGSRYPDGGRVGNCQRSDLTIFSFHPVKNMTTGEGGAVTTNDRELYERMLLARSHGITKDPGRLTQNPGPWYYEMQELGFHYRMTDLQAALGISQLKKLDGFAARRFEIFSAYQQGLSGLTWLKLPSSIRAEQCCFHLFAVQIDFEQIDRTRAAVMAALLEQGVGTQVHYIPVHLQPWYRSTFGYAPGSYPIAENYYSRSLSLPLFPGMTESDVARVIEAVRSLA